MPTAHGKKSRNPEHLAVQILTLIHFVFFKIFFVCIFCCGVTLVAFLCPVYTVEYIYVFLT